MKENVPFLILTNYFLVLFQIANFNNYIYYSEKVATHINHSEKQQRFRTAS